ncbi:hypothetical protein Slin15195_G072620 [Septoria linicola]|uniref:Uncharacterized protein n=1 Tax=Septoria linicola TaxID=215465 RepID=A0A9Q9ELZ9_9PEZI|nr:hypothetical protein Slin15195_G072620 [Septoria linicola]
MDLHYFQTQRMAKILFVVNTFTDNPDLDIASIKLVNDIFPQLDSLEVQVSQAQSDTWRRDEELEALRHEVTELRRTVTANQNTRSTLARACNELAANGTLSRLVRDILAQDAPDVLASIDRQLACTRGRYATPFTTNVNRGLPTPAYSPPVDAPLLPNQGLSLI